MTLQEMGYMFLGKVEYEVSQTKGEAIISRTDVDTHTRGTANAHVPEKYGQSEKKD